MTDFAIAPISPPSPALPTLSAPLAGSAQTASTFRDFEAVMLKEMVAQMMPREAGSIYGSGAAGGFWQSWMAGAIADQIAAAGGIGIADMLQDQFDQRAAIANGPSSAASP